MVLVGQSRLLIIWRLDKSCFFVNCQRLSCVSKFQPIGGGVLFQQVSLQVLPHLTKRAPDAGDSGAIPSIFLHLSLFPVGRRPAARPSAGNANR